MNCSTHNSPGLLGDSMIGLGTAESDADWLKSKGLKCGVVLGCKMLMGLGLRGIWLLRVPDSCGDETAGY